MREHGKLTYSDKYVRKKEYAFVSKKINEIVKELASAGFYGHLEWNLYDYNVSSENEVYGGICEISKRAVAILS